MATRESSEVGASIMQHTPTCVVAACFVAPSIATPIPLCSLHAAEVLHAYGAHRLVAERELLLAKAIVTPEQERLIDNAQAVARDSIAKGTHPCVVYFILNGTRVKIGFTKNLLGRLESFGLRRDHVLLLLDGDVELERALHIKFGELRIDGTEWFELNADVLRFVAIKDRQRPNHVVHRNQRRSVPMTEMIIRHIEANGPSLPAAVALGIGESKDSVRAVMSQMRRKGQLAHDPERRYVRPIGAA